MAKPDKDKARPGTVGVVVQLDSKVRAKVAAFQRAHNDMAFKTVATGMLNLAAALDPAVVALIIALPPDDPVFRAAVAKVNQAFREAMTTALK